MMLDRDLPHVWTLRDGLIVKWRVFETREQAFEAARLSELCFGREAAVLLCMESRSFGDYVRDVLQWAGGRTVEPATEEDFRCAA
jgi:hypothetical protein